MEIDTCYFPRLIHPRADISLPAGEVTGALFPRLAVQSPDDGRSAGHHPFEDENKNAYTGMTSVCKSCLLQSDDFILPSPFLPWKAPLQNCPPESNISVNICHKVK